MPGLSNVSSDRDVHPLTQGSETLMVSQEKWHGRRTQNLKASVKICYTKDLNLGKIEYQVLVKTQKQKEFAQVQIQEVLEDNKYLKLTYCDMTTKKNSLLTSSMGRKAEEVIDNYFKSMDTLKKHIEDYED